ncbi:hypothetical protein LH425_06600 [Laribacter hongkongensis]|uniref:hypothetical protein n=1 Tax=Laribacter hongkongensis TaxID=168471 RepID=UPI001EFE052F|nr:hypothetical protein [Laribacter hongkongensis]MCG9064713.1 hypothetical protein [Laribacter hongkongensis]
MLDVSEIFDDPDLAQEVDFEIRGGSFDASGQWVDEYTPVTMTAVVHATKPDDLTLLPEGERHLPARKVMTTRPLAVGDFLLYQGARWRVSASSDWSEYGFHNAIAIRHNGPAAPAQEAFVVT